MTKVHEYKLTVKWTGNKGTGTSSYRAYDRNHTILTDGKPDIPGSADPSFRGDKTRYNPEELLVAALSSCHMLSFLHMCAQAGVIVTDYEDGATGFMEETASGGGHFTKVILHPKVTVQEESMKDKLDALHHQASELCFIANSCNFPIHHEPVGLVQHHRK